MKADTEIRFDMEAALAGLREGKGLSGKDGILTPLIKQLTEAAMQAELDEHLAHERQPNRKNGSTCKTMKSPAGEFELATPRDRAGTFEPQLVKKHQTHLTDDLERKVLALFALGNSYQDIRSHIAQIYDIALSNGTINAVTDKLLPELEAWRERDLRSGLPDCLAGCHSLQNQRKWTLYQQSYLHHPGTYYRRQERITWTLLVRPGRRPSLAKRTH